MRKQRAAMKRIPLSRVGRQVTVVMLVIVTTILTACSASQHGSGPIHHYQVSNQPAAPAQQIFRRTIQSSPRTLDPSLSTGVPATNVLGDLFEGLTSIDPSAKVVPGVAKSWTISPDGKTYVFHLRHDARWSNGAPVTAKDFVYAWRREVDPKTAAQYAEALNPIVNAAAIISAKLSPDKLGVTALDPYTLQVNLVAPTPYFLSVLSNTYYFPLYAPTIRKWAVSWTQPPHLISNGAFYLKTWMINGHLTLLKNPYYWGAKKVRLQKVIVYPISDQSSTLARYLADDLDFANSPAFPPSDVDWLRHSLGSQLQIAPYYGNAFFGMLVHQPPFNNRDLRLALSMSLNRQVLSNKVGQGLTVPAYSLMPPLPGYTQQVPAWASWPFAKRLAEARRLYRQAGYSAKHPLRVRLLYPTGGPAQRHFMEAVTTMWKQNLGADVILWNEQWKVMLQDIQYKNAKLYWSAWIGDYPDPFTFMQQFQKGYAMNYGDFDYPAYQSLLARAQADPDNRTRYQLFEQAERVLNAQEPFIPMYFYTSDNLVKPYVAGWKANILDRHLAQYIYIRKHEEH